MRSYSISIVSLLMLPALFATGCACPFLSPGDAGGEWTLVETVTVHGVQNSLPQGGAIKKHYPPGTYRLVLNEDTPGICYDYRVDFVHSKGCFVKALENTLGSGVYHSVALSEVDGVMEALLTSKHSLEAMFFIMDWNRKDNDGFVKVDVYRRK